MSSVVCCLLRVPCASHALKWGLGASALLPLSAVVSVLLDVSDVNNRQCLNISLSITFYRFAVAADLVCVGMSVILLLVVEWQGFLV